MDINSKVREVCIDLFESQNGLYAYTLYGRYGLTPTEAVTFIDDFKKKGIITIDSDNRISFTSEGRQKILSIVKSVDKEEENGYYSLNRFITDDYMEINAPYLPNESFYIKYIEREVDKSSQ